MLGSVSYTHLDVYKRQVLDTPQQVESHLLMRHYDGLLKSGRIKGRAGVAAVSYTHLDVYKRQR